MNSNRYAKVLVFSPPGHGKTTFMSTARSDPRTAPVLYLDFEGGTDSISDCLEDPNFTLVSMHSWEDFYKTWDLLVSGRHQEIVGDSGKKRIPFKSVCIDSVTALNVRAFMRTISSRGPLPPRMPEQSDYGNVLNTMRDIVLRFVDLDMHIFMSALSDDSVDQFIGTVREPHFIGSITHEIGGFLSAVLYLALTATPTGEEERVLVLKNPVFRTKVRLPKGTPYPDMIVDPTISKLLDALQI